MVQCDPSKTSFNLSKDSWGQASGLTINLQKWLLLPIIWEPKQSLYCGTDRYAGGKPPTPPSFPQLISCWLSHISPSKTSASLSKDSWGQPSGFSLCLQRIWALPLLWEPKQSLCLGTVRYAGGRPPTPPINGPLVKSWMVQCDPSNTSSNLSNDSWGHASGLTISLQKWLLLPII